MLRKCKMFLGLAGFVCAAAMLMYAQAPAGPGPAGKAKAKGKAAAQPGLALGVGQEIPPNMGVLMATVVEKGTKLPLERVIVEIVSPTGSQQQAATNPEGQFQILLPAGSNRLTLRRQGDSGNIGIPTVKVVAVPQSVETKAEIEIPQTAEVSGRVLDSRGEPLPGVRVTLLLRTYEIWSTSAIYQNTPLAAQTNDVGEYRITEVPDGIAFFLYAEAQTSQGAEPLATAAADSAARRPINASTFFPAAVDPGGAQSVTLNEGERREGVDIRMARSASYCIEDTVLPRPMGGQYTIQVDVKQVGGGIFNDIGSYRRGRMVLLDPQGKARVCGLWPGTYRFTVQPQNRTPPPVNGATPEIFFGSGEFIISDKDVRTLTVIGSSMFDAAGEVLIDGATPAKPVETQIRIAMVALTPTGQATQAITTIPGKFSLKNRNIDRYFLRFQGLNAAGQGLPDGWYVKNVMYGNEDMNLRVNRFILDKPDTTIKVVLGQNGARLKVKVTNDKGEPVMGKRVIVVRSGLNEAPKLVGQLLTSYTDEKGECSTWTLVIEPPRAILAPGEYFVLAADLPYNQTADVLEQVWRTLQGSGTRVTLQPGATADLTIKATTLR